MEFISNWFNALAGFISNVIDCVARLVGTYRSPSKMAKMIATARKEHRSGLSEEFPGWNKDCLVNSCVHNSSGWTRIDYIEAKAITDHKAGKTRKLPK